MLRVSPGHRHSGGLLSVGKVGGGLLCCVGGGGRFRTEPNRKHQPKSAMTVFQRIAAKLDIHLERETIDPVCRPCAGWPDAFRSGTWTYRIPVCPQPRSGAAVMAAVTSWPAQQDDPLRSVG